MVQCSADLKIESRKTELKLYKFLNCCRDYHPLDCTPRNHQGTIAAGKIRRNVKFAAFWCVFLTKIKVYPESW